jgi:hypothetical protein
MANKATVTGSRSGPPLDVMVVVDGAPVQVVFELFIRDPKTKQQKEFGPMDPVSSTLGHRYRVPGPTWWQHGKIIYAQVDGEPGPWAQNPAYLVAFQGDHQLEGHATELITASDPDGIQLYLELKLV